MRQSPERLVWWLSAAAHRDSSRRELRAGRRRAHGRAPLARRALGDALGADRRLRGDSRRSRVVGGVRAAPTDLARIDGGVLTAPRGPWVAVRRPAPRGPRRGAFLFDTAGGRSVRIRSGSAVFSANGTRAAWAEERIGFFERRRKSDLFVADLASAKAVETGLDVHSVWCRIALSPSGSRLAVSDGSTLAAYDISDPANPKQLAAVRAEVGSRAFVFVDEDTVRIFPRFFNAATPEGHRAARSRDRGDLPAFEEIPRDRPLRTRDAPLPAPQRGRAVPRRNEKASASRSTTAGRARSSRRSPRISRARGCGSCRAAASPWPASRTGREF